MSGAANPGSVPGGTLRGVLTAVALLTLVVAGAVALPPARALGYPTFEVTITGPSLLAQNGSGVFNATASGGPAEYLNGTYYGNYTFTDEVLGANTTGSYVSPPSGAFTGLYEDFTVGGLNTSGTYTLELNVTSHGTTNLTQIFSYQFQVVQPFLITATVQNLNTYTVSGAIIDVALDGTEVGKVSLPSMTPSGTVAVKYNYTTMALGPGWHTFTLTIRGPGLLVFSNGESSYSVSFYVNPAPPDYTLYYLYGLSITVGCIVITVLLFAPRRTRRKRSE